MNLIDAFAQKLQAEWEAKDAEIEHLKAVLMTESEKRDLLSKERYRKIERLQKDVRDFIKINNELREENARLKAVVDDFRHRS